MNAFFSKYYKGGDILDVGCGWGSAIKANIRLDKAKIIIGTRTCANVFGDFHYLPFKSNSISYLYSNHSIEHAKYQDIAIKEWVRVLTIGGIFHVSWPGWLERRDPKEYIEKFRESEEALSQKDTHKYLELGMDPNWISIDSQENMFLDAHWNVCGLDEMLTRLPSNLKILETCGAGDCLIIAEKIE